MRTSFVTLLLACSSYTALALPSHGSLAKRSCDANVCIVQCIAQGFQSGMCASENTPSLQLLGLELLGQALPGCMCIPTNSGSSGATNAANAPAANAPAATTTTTATQLQQ